MLPRVASRLTKTYSFCTALALKGYEQLNGFNGTGMRNFFLIFFRRPDFFAVTALNALRTLWIVTITNHVCAITYRAEMAFLNCISRQVN